MMSGIVGHGTRTATALAAFACLVAGTILVAPAAAAERTVIGSSVQGRPILATLLGEPQAPEQVLVFGSVHGNETAGMRVTRRLLASRAPHNAAIRIVPTLNPDGVAADTRGNAHGVDLNRNFPYDWQPLTGGEYSGTGGLSEPESRAARRLIRRTKPDVTIWFHQPFGIVDRPSGDPAVARRFSQLIGLPLVSLKGRYPGSASRWQNHALPAAPPSWSSCRRWSGAVWSAARRRGQCWPSPPSTEARAWLARLLPAHASRQR